MGQSWLHHGKSQFEISTNPPNNFSSPVLGVEEGDEGGQQTVEDREHLKGNIPPLQRHMDTYSAEVGVFFKAGSETLKNQMSLKSNCDQC